MMKNLITFIVSFVTAVVTAVAVTSTSKNVYAAESESFEPAETTVISNENVEVSEMPISKEEMARTYYDLNGSSSIDVADVVLGYTYYLKEYKLTELDCINICKMIVDENAAIELAFFEEDISFENTPYDMIVSTFQSYVCDLQIEADDLVRMRTIKNGIITELRAPIDEVVDPLCSTVFKDETVKLGLNRGGDYVFDTYGFDIAEEGFEAYVHKLQKIQLEQNVALDCSKLWLENIHNNWHLAGLLCTFTWNEPIKAIAYYRNQQGDYEIISFSSTEKSEMDEILYVETIGDTILTFGVNHHYDDCPEGHLACNVNKIQTIK